MEFISRVDAKARKLTRFYTGQACVNGHVAERQTSTGACIVCRRDVERRFYASSPARQAKVNESAANWAKANPEKCSKTTARYRARNKDKRKAYNEEYRKAHLAECCERVKLRYKRVVAATPSWVNPSDFASIYAVRDALMGASEMRFEVDHFVPIQNNAVCGLHVPWNMRVVSTTENRTKANKLFPEMAINYSAPGWAYLQEVQTFVGA